MARILVLGSSNTDLTVRLPRLPLPGQTMLGGSLLTGPGGKGANQAVAAARAGGEVVFITAVGDDENGRQALEMYRREGINTDYALVKPGVASGVALIFVAEGGENMIAVAPGANALLTMKDIEHLPADLFCKGDLLLIGGLEIPIETVAFAAHRAREADMKVVLNPAPVVDVLPESLLQDIDVLTPNRVENGELTCIETPGIEALLHASQTLLQSGPKAIVVTLGDQGCLVRRRTEFHLIPACPVTAVDAVAAGDAFNGALAVALAEGRSLFDAATWANAAAALAVTRPGAQNSLPTRREIDRFASGQANSGT